LGKLDEDCHRDISGGRRRGRRRSIFGKKKKKRSKKRKNSVKGANPFDPPWGSARAPFIERLAAKGHSGSGKTMPHPRERRIQEQEGKKLPKGESPTRKRLLAKRAARSGQLQKKRSN